MAEFSPGGDDGLEGGALGAAAAHGGVELEGEVLLGDALAHEREDLEQGGVGDGGGPLHAGDLRRVLDARGAPRPHWTWATSLSPPTSVGPGRAAPLQVTLSASRPMRAAAAPPSSGVGRLALRGPGADDDLDLRRGAGPLDLLGRLGAVAAVGGEQGAVARDERGRRPTR